MPPRLTVVVAGSRPGGPPAELVSSLAPGLEDGSIELLVATAAAPPPEAARRGVEVRSWPSGTTVPRLRAEGLRAARASIAALTEDFCLPAPGWAEVLLEAHAASDAVAVGGPMGRRSGRATDWALTFQEYGRFFHCVRRGPVRDLPGTNVSYKLAALAALLGGLPGEVEEVALHARLRSLGATLVCEPGALMHDASERDLGAVVRSLFHHGRLFAGGRVRGRSPLGRAARLALSPLAPAAQLARLVPPVLAAGHGLELLRAGPALGLLLAAWAAGEAAGSLLGEGRSRDRWV